MDMYFFYFCFYFGVFSFPPETSLFAYSFYIFDYIASHILIYLIITHCFSPEIRYFLRFIPLIRGGYALAIVVGWLSYNKASSLFTSYLTMLLATVYFSSLIFFVLEHKVNPLVPDYGEALWWAFMDVTTVGSNIYAVTITGKVLSVLLAALGMMMFPIFTVYVTSLVQKANSEKKDLYQGKDSSTTSSPVVPSSGKS